MASYEGLVARLGQATAGKLLGLYGRLVDGTITETEFTGVAADLVAGSNLRAAALADLVLRAYLERKTRVPVAVAASQTAAALPPKSDPPRLRKALGTILAGELDTEMQLTRLATSETTHAAAEAFSASLPRYKGVTGWVRGLDGNACELCQWWWRDGRVWPADHPMPRHQGCLCHQVPTVATNIKSTGYTRRMASTG